MVITFTPPPMVLISVSYEFALGIPEALRTVLKEAQKPRTDYNPDTGRMTVTTTIDAGVLERRLLSLRHRYWNPAFSPRGDLRRKLVHIENLLVINQLLRCLSNYYAQQCYRK